MTVILNFQGEKLELLTEEEVNFNETSGRIKMEGYQKRVIEEREELDSKVEKLGAFLVGGPIENDERKRLVRQKAAMLEYSNILAERIAEF